MARRGTTTRALAAFGWLAATACSGQIGPGQGDGASSGAYAGHDGASSGRGTGGATQVPPALPDSKIPTLPPDRVDACAAGTLPPSTAPTTVRRLNRREYDNTVRDLLGDATGPASAFPAEERGFGFDNNADALTTSPALVEQYVTVAEAVAARAVQTNLAKIVPCDAAKTGAAACGRQFVETWGKRAYRRPLTTDETTKLVALFTAGAKTDFATGVQLVISAVLQSAPFLYRVETGTKAAGDALARPTSWEMATRLSYLLWSTTPDDVLLSAAATDSLRTAEQVAAQADRMLKDARAKDTFARFHELWLRTELLPSLDKDATAFPAFGPTVRGAMQQQTRLFVDDWLWAGKGDLATLLTTPTTFLNGPLAKLYGVSGPSGEALSKVSLDPKQRPGILAHGPLMAMLAHSDQTSPVHRGKFVRERLLCGELAPPPPNVVVQAPELDPKLTTRERFAAHSTNPSCKGCHMLMDPIGLGFENLDAVGRWRDNENGKAVTGDGEVVGTDVAGRFASPAELSAKLAASEEVRSCVVLNWFRFATAREETDADACAIQRLRAGFANAGYGVPALVAAITQSDAFLYLQPGTP